MIDNAARPRPAPDDPGFGLLLACIRADLGLAEPGEIGGAVRAVRDWERVKAGVLRHGLLPLLHHRLVVEPVDGVPADVAAWIVERFRAHTFRALGLTRELLRLLARFQARGIAVIAFKGPILAQQIYGQVARREYLDLDLLVRAADVQAAADLLRQEGYEPQFPLTRAQLGRYQTMDCELAWSSAERGAAVDLHWTLAPPPFTRSFPESVVWAVRHEVNLSGQTVRTLPPDTLLAYLFFHHAKHDWAYLVWLHDLAMLVRDFDETAWATLHAAARGRRMGRMVLLGARLMRSMVGLPLPGGIGDALRADPRLPGLETAVRELLGRAEVPRRHAPIYRAAMDSRVDVARFWWTEIFQPRLPDWQAIDLPRALHCLYLPMRLVRLVAKRLPFRRRAGAG